MLFSRLMRSRAYVTDISLAGMPARAPSMLPDTIRVGSNTYMGVSRVYDEAMAVPSSVSRAFLDPFLRGVTFLAIEDLDELLANKANQQCHFKTYRAPHISHTVRSLKHPWSSPRNFQFRRCRRSNLDQNLPRITNPVSDLTGDQ